MRIVAGKLKGRTFKGLNALDLRPTSERVREAIFSSINSRIDLKQKVVLDLYAGTGALGIEALSRGAASCKFVEKQKDTCKVLGENLVNFDLLKQSSVENKSVENFLKHNLNSYDLIFADPPYRTVNEADFISLLESSSVFKPGTLFLFEDSINTGLEGYEKLKVLYRKNYGETIVSLLEHI